MIRAVTSPLDRGESLRDRLRRRSREHQATTFVQSTDREFRPTPHTMREAFGDATDHSLNPMPTKAGPILRALRAIGRLLG